MEVQEEQSRGWSMERKGELLYQRFLNTAQETVRLTAALEGFFLEADIEES